MVDVDRLEAVLIAAARARRTLTYAEVLRFFGTTITPRRVYGLCRDLGEVCRRSRERGEPELAVLVVRRSDRLPGEGFFAGERRRGVYAGPSTGPEAASFVHAETARAFDYWAGARPSAAGPARPGPDPEAPAAFRSR